MELTISFFKSRQLERVDYAEIILYFEKELNCKITYTDEEVKMTYYDEVFDFSYDFLITKRSRVKNFALLNPEYVNIRFLVNVPINLPEQTSRQIVSLIDDICQRFDLTIFYDGIKDVEKLDIVKLMNYFLEEKKHYLLSNQEISQAIYYLDSLYLSHIANYHQIRQSLSVEFQNDITINKYQLLTDQLSQDILLGFEWKIGTPAIFPPHLDFLIIDDGNVKQYLPATIFYKKVLRYLYELKDYIPNVSLLLLTSKYVHKVSRKVKHLSKYYVHDKLFSNVPINQIIER